ncbi:hypothetical protein PC9H_006718 [Pleurotus ostreatus]|uniref:Uncharacterized protein n=1 Tax=Pleurotus ostreatus TaxID=5322 RepID=A0A8H6ZWR0_PLEOS|nr:uncharacterized protein PC9H_006718 [Pleurotus ostreatus]KAF7431003.1 hypothetical protein PC9H_006718 [Pleurotus ostreatus]KAJ8695389.1 hypothetical protein PTI98_007992 [Pleurotus ostreatus]
MVYTCQFCGINFDGLKDIRGHLKKGCKGQVDDTSLLDAAERYQAKKKQKREERTAKRRRLMIPTPTGIHGPEDTDESNRDWYDVDETSQSTPDDIDMVDENAAVIQNQTLPSASASSGAVSSSSHGRSRCPTWKVLESQRLLREKEIRAAQPQPQPRLQSEDQDDIQKETPASSIWGTFRSRMSQYGLWREYPTNPTYDPYSSHTADAHNDDDATSPPTDAESLPPKLQDESGNPYFPFTNSSLFGLLSWKWIGSNTKSDIEFGKLFAFLQSTEFSQADVTNTNIDSEINRVDKYIQGSASDSSDEGSASNNSPQNRGGWREVPISISIPDGQVHASLEDAPLFEIPGLHYRSLTEVIQNAIGDPDIGCYFHYTPYKQFFEHDVHIPGNPLDSDQGSQPLPTRVYDEIYASDAMVEAHIELQQQPPEDDCDLERVVAAIMLYSDSTHLASFGTASAWPIYLSFGNESKYVRCKPSTGSCQHLAYIPKLPDTFFEFVHNLTGEGPTTELLTHARRELMHAVWRKLLDDDFIHAYNHGMVIQCADGVFRRFYPRIFTYSADYPEKVLLATIRNLGACPCPRCLTPKECIAELGTQLDRRRRLNTRVNDINRRSRISRVRDWIYTEGRILKNKFIELTLGPKSEVPTSNAFSDCLPGPDFNYFDMFVPDLMHEIELGTWKGLFTHLIRILVAHGGPSIQKLNDGYRAIPSFGQSTICRFSNNASSMKKLAARDFEDLLQCAMPVFEGLLPEPHDGNIQKLLFTFAEWHALAKLRMHTDDTLDSLDQATTDLGRQLRHFEKHTCAAFETKELPKEEAARGRRQNRKQKALNPGPDGSIPVKIGGPKLKRFNLLTYKFHSMGDYVRTIRRFGTTDSYSTQPGELQHKRPKVFYVRTSKNKALRQMTKHEARERLVHIVNARLHRISWLSMFHRRSPPQSQILAEASRPYTPPSVHHTIAKSINSPRNIYSILRQHENDPALTNFIPKLKQHLLSRLLHSDEYVEDEEFNREDWDKIQISGNRLYLHKKIHVNYTSYDVRLGEDTIHPRTHPDIMTLQRNEADPHPFSYARVLSVFHVRIQHEELSPQTKEFDVLWVRHFKVNTRHSGGLKQKQFTRLSFMDVSEAFGFLNPDEVIRGSHIIPAFAYGPAPDSLGRSIARQTFHMDILDKNFTWPKEPDEDDYVHYYVNFFVDRDMFMRYHGGGIGHYKVHFPAVLNEDSGVDDDEEAPIVDSLDQPEPSIDPIQITSEELEAGDHNPAPQEEPAVSDEGSEGEESDPEDDEDVDKWVDEEDALNYSPL